MAKTKREQAEELAEKIETMTNRKKLLLQQAKEEEKNNRTHRLCKRAGLLESLLPETLELNDDQFKNFLEMTLLTDYTRSRIADARAGKLSHHSIAQAMNTSAHQKPANHVAQKSISQSHNNIVDNDIA